jgi:hypothetical protein
MMFFSSDLLVVLFLWVRSSSQHQLLTLLFAPQIWLPIADCYYTTGRSIRYYTGGWGFTLFMS